MLRSSHLNILFLAERRDDDEQIDTNFVDFYVKFTQFLNFLEYGTRSSVARLIDAQGRGRETPSGTKKVDRVKATKVGGGAGI
jgi:hypothetical protein